MDEKRAEETRGAEDPGALLRRRQKELSRQYMHEPTAAWTHDHARTAARGEAVRDPLHTRVRVGPDDGREIDVAVHRKIGGLHEEPVPGDLLAASLAACLDSTIRVVANRLHVEIESLEVDVRADVDVRGTLCVAPEIPVGFQEMHADVRLALAPGTTDRERQMLLQFAEHCCVVAQTLRAGVPVEVAFDTAGAGDGRERQ